MKGQLKIFYIFFILFGMVVSLSLCSKTRNMPMPSNSTVSSTDVSASTLPSQYIESKEDDANIYVPIIGYPADGGACVFTAVPKQFTSEQIHAFLTECDDKIISCEKRTIDGKTRFDAICDSGNELLYISNSQYHPVSAFQYINQDKFEKYFCFPIYYSESSYLTNAAFTIGRMFTEPKEFSFASEAEAEQKVRSALAKLGLTELELLRTLYIDHQTMEKVGEILTSNVGSADKSNLPGEWLDTDDAYLFSFALSVHGIPISFYSSMRDTATYSGSNIIVWFANEGITFLTVETPWQVEQAENLPSQIISAQTILEKANARFDSNLVYQDKHIEEIRLQYEYFQNRDKWLLKPVWQVSLSYGIDGFDGRYYDFMRFNAYTGEEL